MKKIFLLVLALTCQILISTEVQAETKTCEQLGSFQAIVNCAMERHPEIQRQESMQNIGLSLEKQASQRINPEIDDQSVFGNNLNQSVSTHQINLAHTFELGGKRPARMEAAKAESSNIVSQALHIKEEVFMTTVKTLYRIRQVHAEMKILDEALETFGKIQKQFKSRPRLGPEQEVSLSVFQLAQGDYQLRKNELQTEESQLENSIELSIGQPFPHNDSVLPMMKKEWPVIQMQDSEFRGSAIGIAQSEMNLAQAKLEMAKSEAWPNLKLGPSAQQTSDGVSSYWQYGFNVSLPLPLYQTNSAGKKVAALELSRARQNMELTRKELSSQKKILIMQYQNAVQSLQQSVSSREIEQRHKKIDQLFERGVVTSSLVIEAHRQMLDFTKNQHNQEVNALEAWMKICALEGKLFEGVL